MQRPNRREVVEVAVENFLETFGVPAIARIEDDDDLIIVEYDASLRGRARAEAIKTVLEPVAERQRHRRSRDALLPIPILVAAWEAVRAHQRAAIAASTAAATVAAGAIGLAVIETDRPPPTAAPAASSVRTITMRLPPSTPTRARPTLAAAAPARAAPEQTRPARRHKPQPTRGRPRARTPAPEPKPEPKPTIRATPSPEQEPPTVAAADLRPTMQPPADDRPTVDEKPTPQPQPDPEPQPEPEPPPTPCRLIELELGRLVKVCL